MKLTINVTGMMCNGCERAVEGAARRADGVIAAKANHKTGKVEIEYTADPLDLAQIGANIERVGYHVAGQPG